MILYSSGNKKERITFKEAIMRGTSDDGGLYIPVEIPQLAPSFINNIKSFSFKEIAYTISELFLIDEIAKSELRKIVDLSMAYTPQINRIRKDDDGELMVLELFHGPTLAFKDYGARFMAHMLSYFNNNERGEEIVVLAATSGDTGSAVANSFYNMPGIRVIILYPSKKVSTIQEKQLTTLGQNVKALEVEGSFDDCQRLVKMAFADPILRKRVRLTSANSINIARLIPQSFYYFWAYSQLEELDRELLFSVPSGNLGNLTGGLLAKKMGLPVNRFIAAVNSNDVFYKYLKTGNFLPKPSVQTISNAMDVGDPSNFIRVKELLEGDRDIINSVLYSKSFSDGETLDAIRSVYTEHSYLLDPHGAVGYLALVDYLKENPGNYNSILLETAHPAKFLEVVKEAVNVDVQIPKSLFDSLHKEKEATYIQNSYQELFDNILR